MATLPPRDDDQGDRAADASSEPTPDPAAPTELAEAQDAAPLAMWVGDASARWLINSHPAPLAADEALGTIEGWLRPTGGRGWILISGGAGSGKSALVATLIRRLTTTRGAPAHHFIRRGHRDWDQPYAVQAALVVQLERQYPDVANVDAPPERRLIELLLRLSNRHLIPNCEKLYILIDGLDELDSDGEENPLPRFLPPALPPGVMFICSLRAGHPYAPFFEDRAARTLDLDRAFGSRAVRAFWSHHGPLIGLPPDVQIKAARAAEGTLLHAVLLRDLLAARRRPREPAARDAPSRPGLFASADIAAMAAGAIPFGLWGMLEQLSSALWAAPNGGLPPNSGQPAGSAGTAAATDDDRALVRLALGVLCVVHDVLDSQDLCHVCEVSQLPPTFFALAGPLIAFEPDTANTGTPPMRSASGSKLRIRHDAVREMLLARLGGGEIRRLHRRLLARLAPWPPPQDLDAASEQGEPLSARTAYALRHRLRHCVEASDWGAVEQLTSDVRYLTAKVRHVGTLALEHDFALAAGRCPDAVRRKEWRDLQRAVREESYWLRRNPASLPSHLYDRLRCMGWPGARISRAIAIPSTLPSFRLQRGLGARERTLTGHASSVYGCAVTPDGRRLVSASWDRTLKVWDIGSGHQLATLKGHIGEVTGVTLLPGGRRALSSSADHCLRVWDLDTATSVATLQGHTAEVTACAVFPDGQRAVSGSRDHTVRIWDLTTRQTLRTLTGHQSWVGAVAVLPDGARVLSGSWDGTLRLWDALTGRHLATFAGHAAGVRAIAPLANGTGVVSGSEDHTLRLWDLNSGRELRAFRGHTAGITAVALLPDGLRMVSASKDTTLRVWDLHSGETLATLSGHSAWATACCPFPDGLHVASGADDYSIKIWDLAAAHDLQALPGHTAAVRCCAFLPAPDSLLTGSADRTLKVWDLRREIALQTLAGHSDIITSCHVLPPGPLSDGPLALSTSWDRTLRLWDLTRGTLLRTLTGHSWFVTCCTVLPDGTRAVSGSWDRTLRLWDLHAGVPLKIMPCPTSQITCVAAFPDGRTVLSGGRDSLLRIWDLELGEVVATLRGHSDFITDCLVFREGDRLLAASASEDHTLKIWDLTRGDLRCTLHGHAAAVTACALTRDGRALVSVSADHTVRVWDIEKGQCMDTAYGVAPFDSVTATGGRICAGDRQGQIWLLVSASVSGASTPTSRHAPGKG